jgi:hypothetical protein
MQNAQLLIIKASGTRSYYRILKGWKSPFPLHVMSVRCNMQCDVHRAEMNVYWQGHSRLNRALNGVHSQAVGRPVYICISNFLDISKF